MIDEQGKNKVSIDYKRLQEELKLWDYYRSGGSPNHQQHPLYIDDKRGYGFSRIMLILLANKNFEVAKEESLRQITYFHQHPQVIITSLLVGRIVFTLLEKDNPTREELIDSLKEFLISLKREELTIPQHQTPSKKFILQFEQEKINYLMALDRLKNQQRDYQQPLKLDSQGVLIAALENYWRIHQGICLDLQMAPKDDQKEALALAFGFWGISNNIADADIVPTGIKDEEFIESMGEYILKIRNYQVNRKPYQGEQAAIDLFGLTVGSVIKHPILNITKILGRREGKHWIEVTLETKTGEYRLYKKRQ